MCCCAKPTINGEWGYSWDGKNVGTREPNPPELQPDETLLHDEPGRCGGIDSHCHHYRVVKSHGSLWLLVRHGGGDERLRLSGPVINGLEILAGARYWTLNAIYHAYADGRRAGKQAECDTWRKAAAERRIEVRKIRGCAAVKVSIKTARTEIR